MILRSCFSGEVPAVELLRISIEELTFVYLGFCDFKTNVLSPVYILKLTSGIDEEDDEVAAPEPSTSDAPGLEPSAVDDTVRMEEVDWRVHSSRRRWQRLAPQQSAFVQFFLTITRFCCAHVFSLLNIGLYMIKTVFLNTRHSWPAVACNQLFSAALVSSIEVFRYCEIHIKHNILDESKVACLEILAIDRYSTTYTYINFCITTVMK